jgi:DNA-binding GntR family transcriptional regulator
MTRAVVMLDGEIAPVVVPAKLADGAYAELKQDIFDFRLVPGDRFSEAEVAERLGISRTPVREALFRLQREGYLDVTARSGWVVRPFDFEQFEHLYDLRMILETTSVRRLCDGFAHDGLAAAVPASNPQLEALSDVWLVANTDRLSDGLRVAELDEAFHMALVLAAGNPELARVHREVTERIRIIRRLDFTQPDRVETTYDEHGRILRAILKQRADEATALLSAHIGDSKAEVRKITLHCLHVASRALRTPAIVGS